MTNHGEFPIAEFGFPGPIRDRLVASILAGTKTSTSSTRVEYSIEDEPLPVIGNKQTVIDSHNFAVATIQTIGVEIVRLADVGLEHAHDEGEGFVSIAAWRRGHEAFWHSTEMRAFLNSPTFTVDDDTLVVLERFQLIEALGQAKR
ncbi:ASCH domain-containing protein [Cryobacterium sp. TMT1-62]|uniref:ASCH domain-containing protein n=1 Tax=unclassified Cryobacterium TaxID=2649013 RepID=UPI00106ACD89|nr:MULTISPECIES: ASCH domain-containing protein [unclassified Cryobacterium]TFC39058.1 ASCH domain-containing protein [Cryobacterium sp. TMT2-14]TFD30173.1 ASCH domain-containing protein [Cryobacterium sp. TMT1-62]